MKSLLHLFFGFFSLVTLAQTDLDLAESYFDKGEFEKASYYYKKLLEAQPNSSNFIFRLVEIYQELHQFQKAQTLLDHQYEQSNNPQFLVEMGYHFQIQNQNQKAIAFYDNAIKHVIKTPAFAYIVALRFEEHSLVDQAIRVYKLALENTQNLNYEYRLAGLYAEKKDIENMFLSYLNFTEKNPTYLTQVLRLFGDYISQDPSAHYNQLLKTIILKKLQSSSSEFWTTMLSWLYSQQNDFTKALTLEKAMFRRGKESLQGIIDVGLWAKATGYYDVALEALKFVVDNAQDISLKIEAKRQWLVLEIEHLKHPDLNRIQADFEGLIKTYGITNETIEIVLSYTQFLAFNMDQKNDAVNQLKSALKANLSQISSSKLKLKLADILVSQRQFNRALIYYTQVHLDQKNSTLAQEARFKGAKTSFYKGDFDWAETQLNVLKSSTSQLIANDALDLLLLISDHNFGDSLQSPLTHYAKAAFLNFQHKKREAISVLDTLIQKHPTHAIIDQALMFQATILESLGNYEQAAQNYLLIEKSFSNEILIDDAYFALAELYRTHLKLNQKAQEYYEKIIFNHQDSIHFVASKKQYRKLREHSKPTTTLNL